MLNFLILKYMQYNYILGIDIAKGTMDVALTLNKANDTITSHTFANNPKGHRALLNWLKKSGVQLDQVLICLENTGDYFRCLVELLQSEQAFVWVENPMAIKRSGGLQRGKTDRVDAQRICLYAFRNQDKAKGYTPKSKSLQAIAVLSATREALIRSRVALLAPIKEKKAIGLEHEANLQQEACKNILATLEEDIKAIEVQIKAIIQQDEELRRSYEIARSVPGIGFVTAVQLMIYSDNFKRFDNAKQFGSYSGVVPFEYSSGSSIRGKTKLHPMANKKLKRGLHMCALSAIRNNKELKQYYDRKVQEGKNKMSVINAVRNKLLQRVYACVKANRMYDYEYIYKRVA
jgi:transposase